MVRASTAAITSLILAPLPILKADAMAGLELAIMILRLQSPLVLFFMVWLFPSTSEGTDIGSILLVIYLWLKLTLLV